jgi:hypothetical protein
MLFKCLKIELQTYVYIRTALYDILKIKLQQDSYWTVKTLKKHTRALTLKETKALNKIRSTANKDLKRGYKVSHFLLAILLGTTFIFLATWVAYDFLTFAFGTIAVFSFGFVVFMPFEIYKDLKKAKEKIKAIDNVLAANNVEVTPVTAKQIAIAKEYEDEGDLYLVQTDDSHIIYLWDNDYNLKKNFPCLEFEIYSDDVYKLIGRQINPLSGKFKPIVINPKAKWNYLKKAGAPGHLTIEKKDFKKLVERINTAV